MLEKMNMKRWIAVGVAILILGLSAISTKISTMVNQEERMKQIESIFANSFDPNALQEQVITPGDHSNRIAVLKVDGTIMDTPASAFQSVTYNHQNLLASFDRIAEDPTIKGVILEVDSPGGGVYESAEIHKKIEELKANTDIPIWTSMGSMAASGGYYISAPTDKIYATPETLTGSIGVIMSGYNLTGLMEKLGVQDQTIKSGPNKDIMSSSRPMTEEERNIMQGLINNMYGRFVNIVATGRNLDEATVRTIADGRIYDGVQAKENRLVDELGYFDDVVADFSQEIAVENPEVFEYTGSGFSGLSGLFSKASGKSELNALTSLFAESLDTAPRAMYLYGGE